MGVYFNEISIQSIKGRPSYHNITDDIEKKIETSGIANGCIVITSSHTTCSLYFDECMHDINFWGDEYLQVDINETMEKIAPTMKTENQYHSPGPEHIKFGLSLESKDYPSEKWTMLNTDAHIRSSIFGSSSLTFIIKDKKIQLGSLGKIYFVDWDQLRERNRAIQIMIMGE